MTRQARIELAIAGVSLGLIGSLAAAPAAAQKVGQGPAGRAVHILTDSAASRTVSKVYEGLYSYVRIERSEPGAASNRQPVAVTPALLTRALGSLQMGKDPLLDADELNEIAAPLAQALGKAGADQDVSFAVSGRHSGWGPLAMRSVTTARVFRDAQGLQVIVGLAHASFEDQFNATGMLIAFEPGRRAAPVSPSLRLAGDAPGLSWRRGDWASWNLEAMAGAAAPVRTEAGTPAAPAVLAAPAAAAAAAPAAVPAPPAATDVDARARQISERLQILQRLRDSGAITQQEYEARRKAILDSI